MILKLCFLIIIQETQAGTEYEEKENKSNWFEIQALSPINV